METGTTTNYYFGDYELDASKRLLLKEGLAVALKPKTLDLLIAFVENQGRIMSKGELLDKVWVDQFVEENNLTVHVAALRKALGETKNDHRFIVTVPGKGYSFVSALREPTETEIVLERHKFERIVVEEEIEVVPSIAHGGGTAVLTNGHTSNNSDKVKAAAAGWFGQRRLAVALVCFGVLVLLSGYALRLGLLPAFASATPFSTTRIKQLTTSGKVGNAALSPDGKLFAYTVDDLGKKSLLMGYVSGGNHILLRPAAETSYRKLAFSLDSSHLYYSIRDQNDPKGTLYKMPVFGGAALKVLDGINSFALSPDETSIAVARSDTEQKQDTIVIVPLDGSQRRDVASFPSHLSFRFDTISWSADGQRLAVSALKDDKRYQNEVAVIEVATGGITRIPVVNWREITKTAWLKDGSGLVITAVENGSHASVPQYQIVYVDYPSGRTQNITVDRSNYGASWHNDAGTTLGLSDDSEFLLSVEHRQLSNVWVAPSDDLTLARQVTFGSFGKYDGMWGLDWTSEGKLLYTTSDTRSQFIAQMNSDGSEVQSLTQAGKVDSVVTATNDGHYVVFHSDRGEAYEIDIWRMDIDGANPKRLTFGGKAYQPFPSADGRWVYYRSMLRGGAELCRVPMDGGDPECFDKINAAWGSFSPDGKYFAANYRTDKGRLAIFDSDTLSVVNQFDIAKTGTLFMGSRWTPDGRAVVYRDIDFGYWIQPIDGGEARRMEGLPEERLYNFAWSKDGNWFAFVRGQEIRDVVLIENTAN